MSLPPEIVVEVYFPPFTSGVTVVEQPMEVTVARTIPSAAGPVVWSFISDIPPAVDAIDGLVPAPDRVPYYTGATSAALTPLTAFGRSLIDDTDAATARATLGAQRAIQFKSEGNNLGGDGAVAAVDFVGPGVSATFSGGTVTVSVTGGGGGGGGASTFVDLTDTPASYSGAGSSYVRVNAASDGLEFRTPTQVLGDIGAAPATRAINTNNGLTGGGNLTADRTIGLTGQALALHNLSTSGLIARTGAGTVAARTLTAGSNISITNGDGVAGNPTIAVAGLAAVATSGSASDLNTGTLAIARGGTGAGTAAGARANLGAAASGAIGSSGLTMATNYVLGRTSSGTGAIEEIGVGFGLSLSGGSLQLGSHTHPYGDITDLPAAIDAIDGLTPAADRVAYYTGASTAALTPLTTFGRSLIDDADAAAGRATLGAQRAVQFQDEGSNLGTAGTVSTVNFTGSGVTASRSGDTITVNVTGGGGGGASTFLDLSDTPSAYTGAAGNYVRVNNTPDGLEFRTAAQVLSDIGAAPASHTHSAADITTGTLAVGRGGTGISSYTAGNYIRAASASSLEQRTPAQVLSDIGAAAASHTHTVSEVSGAVPDTRTISTTNGITGGGDLTANRTLELTGQALALHNLATNGLIVRTGAGTVAARTIAAGANISVTNGDGVAGNPTIDVVGLAAVATSGSASDLVSGTLAISRGGTGANTAAGARANLGAAASGAVGSSGLTMSTDRLLGRTTSGSGSIEEISVGAGLSLASTTLSLGAHTHALGDITDIAGPAIVGRVASTSGPASAISPVHSVVLDANGLRLVNDAISPGNNQYYGTNASGVRGWYSLPSGGGGGTAGIEPWRWYVMQALVDSGTDIYTLFGERLVEVHMRPFHGHVATQSSVSGTGAAVTTVGNGGAPTWLQNSNGPHRAPNRVSTGTTATGSAIFYAFPLTSERVDFVPFSSARPFCWGDIAVDTLSDSDQRFHVRAGFAMSPLFSDHAANVSTTFSLYYRDDVNGGRWAILWRTTDTNGAQTLVDTGITVAAATRVRFCFVAISNNQVRAWVRQGSSEYRDTITVSSSAGLNTIWAGAIVKSVGTTARFLWVRDYGSGVWYPS